MENVQALPVLVRYIFGSSSCDSRKVADNETDEDEEQRRHEETLALPLRRNRQNDRCRFGPWHDMNPTAWGAACHPRCERCPRCPPRTLPLVFKAFRAAGLATDGNPRIDSLSKAQNRYMLELTAEGDEEDSEGRCPNPTREGTADCKSRNFSIRSPGKFSAASGLEKDLYLYGRPKCRRSCDVQARERFMSA